MLKKLFAGLTVFTLAAIVGVSLGRAEDGEVLSHVKITDGVGGFEATFTGVDNFGAGVSDIGDLNGDGVNDIVVGAPYDSEMTDGGGAVYILFLETNGSLHTAQVGGAPAAGYQKISATTGGGVGAIDDYDGFGMSVAGIGDVDGDTIPDIAVGSPFDQTNKGSIYVIFLDRNGTMDDTVEYVKIGGAGSGGMPPGVIGDFEQFGFSVANAGDLNSDGIAEIAVGSWSNDTGGSNRGSVYILFLDNTGSLDGSSGVSGVGYTFIANNTGGLAYTLGNGDNFGVSVAGLGDINGDEIPDIAVGAAKDDTAGDNKGTVFILFLDTDGQVLDEQRITDSVGGFTTLGAGDYFGYSVAGLSDMNGDGVNDLAVGAYGDDDGGSNFGAVYILFLTATGELDGASGTSGSGYTKISAEAGGFAGTLEADDYFGNGLGALADMNDDGIPELVAGAYLDDDAGGNRGAIYILFLDGTLASTPTPTSPNPPSAFTFAIADTSSCTWDPNIYLSVKGSNLAQVIVSDNLRFVGAQVLPYTPNNGSTVLPDHLTPVDNTMYIAFKLPSYATGVDPATGEQIAIPLYGPYSVYAVGRSGSGNITSIQTDSITFSSSEDCTYPYEVILEDDTGNGSEEGNEGGEGEEEPVDPLIPVERHQIISLSANMNDLTNEFYLVDTAADGSLVKRPDPRVTNYDISFSWLNKGYPFLSVNQRTLDSLPTAHAMLPEGPAILKFTEGSQNYFYIPSDNSAPREITTPNLANELFLGTNWQSSVWILGPEVPSSSVPHGRTIPRYDVAIVRDWRNNR